MPLHPDWKEFLELLNSHAVDYLVVGGHARGLHGIPRYTRDIDILVRISEANASKLVLVLLDFGFASLEITADRFLVSGRVVQLGVEPYRIDLLTNISGVNFEDAWSDRVAGELDGVPVSFISLRAFRKNKLAAGRPRDLADLADLPE